ncbi:hypothetical protein TNCV_1076601 [Trichonephila clavipes]|uniref:Uncharacterized protein n=1 Tax=Trichonephila clavipes TaxID=2585209 RepID=A0A8X6V8T5_TRICX|nr:hypothetical protein TNCV_1076601 [Trichonephila clavipes]
MRSLSSCRFSHVRFARNQKKRPPTPAVKSLQFGGSACFPEPPQPLRVRFFAKRISIKRLPLSQASEVSALQLNSFINMQAKVTLPLHLEISVFVHPANRLPQIKRVMMG